MCLSWIYVSAQKCSAHSFRNKSSIILPWFFCINPAYNCPPTYPYSTGPSITDSPINLFRHSVSHLSTKCLRNSWAGTVNYHLFFIFTFSVEIFFIGVARPAQTPLFCRSLRAHSSLCGMGALRSNFQFDLHRHVKFRAQLAVLAESFRSPRWHVQRRCFCVHSGALLLRYMPTLASLEPCLRGARTARGTNCEDTDGTTLTNQPIMHSSWSWHLHRDALRTGGERMWCTVFYRMSFVLPVILGLFFCSPIA